MNTPLHANQLQALWAAVDPCPIARRGMRTGLRHANSSIDDSDLCFRDELARIVDYMDDKLRVRDHVEALVDLDTSKDIGVMLHCA